MVDKIEETIRRYYAIIVAVVGFVLAIIAAIYSITKPLMDDTADLKADVREMRAGIVANSARHDEARVRFEREFERVWESLRRIEGKQTDDKH